MESALRPGDFVDYGESWDFVRGLDTVEEQIGRLIKSQPARAVELLETFIAGCYEKAEEIDDSSGSFGQFVEGLLCSWIRARQAAKGDPHDIVEQLLGWMSDDDYGFCLGIEREAVKALNKAGLKAFAETVHEQWTAELERIRVREKGDKMTPGSSRFRRLSDVLRSVYAEQRDPERYLAIAEEMGLTPRDCEALAEIHEKRKKPEEALKWCERGLAMEREEERWGRGSSDDLEALQRKLLKKLGREAEALKSAWEEFKNVPSEYSYRTLLEYVPRGERSQWHAKVLKVTQQTDLCETIDLYVELKEWNRLAERIRKAKAPALEDLSHYTTEPAAKKLQKTHPDAAAKLFQAMALRILNAKKSRYYDAALENLASARKCLEKVGSTKKWEDLVATIRSEHSRKRSFMAGFEALLARGSLPEQLSFLDRARKRKARQFRAT